MASPETAVCSVRAKARLTAQSLHRARSLPEVSATERRSVLVDEQSFLAVRSDWSAVFPEALQGFASAT